MRHGIYIYKHRKMGPGTGIVGLTNRATLGPPFGPNR